MTEKKSNQIQNLTQYFFQQSQNPCTQFNDKIEEFRSKLFNVKTCILCKQDYNLKSKIPRILIHCGHSFCSACLIKFHRNGRIRCPLCLQLVKHIEMIERLPVNHTVVTQILNQQNAQARELGRPEQDVQAFLYKHFEISQNIAQNGIPPIQQNIPVDQMEHMQQQQVGVPQNNFRPPQELGKGPRIDPQTGLEWCEKHFDRIKHFFCLDYKQIYCRVCAEFVQQNVPNCTIVDLYQIEDLNGFLLEYGTKEHSHLIKYNQPGVVQGNPGATNLGGGVPGMPNIQQEFLKFNLQDQMMGGKEYAGYDQRKYNGILDQNLDDEQEEEEEEEQEEEQEEDDGKNEFDIQDITNLKNYGNNPDYQYQQGNDKKAVIPDVFSGSSKI